MKTKPLTYEDKKQDVIINRVLVLLLKNYFKPGQTQR